MMATLLCRSLLGAVILGGVHWIEGPMDGFSGGATSHVTHLQCGVSAAWHSMVSATGA